MTRLWLALRLQDLPLRALNPQHSAEAAGIVVQKKRVVYATPAASAQGVEQGMDVTTAQLLSSCTRYERDTAREQQVLDRLADKLYEFTPYITQHLSRQRAQSALLLELSSCLSLFAGVKNLVGNISQAMAQTPYGVSCSLGYSASSAWLLSFAPSPITGEETYSSLLERLNALPISLLFDYPKAQEALSKMGFVCLGDIARQISAHSIAVFRKRLGDEFASLLIDLYQTDQNFKQGLLFEAPRQVYTPKEWFEEELQFDYPVAQVDYLKPALETLLVQLCRYMRKRQQQCQYIEWVLASISKRTQRLSINSDGPQSQWQLLFELSVIQLEAHELPFEVDAIKLICRHFMPLQPLKQVLNFSADKQPKYPAADVQLTLAKLKARLGDGAICKVHYQDNLVPELTNVFIALNEKCQQTLPAPHRTSLRPTWLLPEPVAIAQRGERLYWQGYLTLLAGPERITSAWWEASIARDYYLARRQDQMPVWIFFDLHSKHWFVHGVFA